MTTYASYELSKKLMELECKSLSNYSWVFENNEWFLSPSSNPQDIEAKGYIEKPCFSLYDFIAPTEVARENCKKIWPERFNAGIPCPDGKPGCAVFHSKVVWIYDEKRHKLIDFASEEEAWKIIEEALCQ